MHLLSFNLINTQYMTVQNGQQKQQCTISWIRNSRYI